MTDIVPAHFTENQIEIMRQTVAAGVPPSEFALFLEVCMHRGLNPMNREIYAIMRYDYQTKGKRMTIQVSIDGLRILAERSGEYLGQLAPEWCGEDGQWMDVWLKDTPPVAARVRVMRSGFKQTMTAVAKYSSYVQLTSEKNPTATWAKMPDVMLAKCAEALCLRKTFPETMSGLYTSDEMGQADNPIPANTVDALPPKPKAEDPKMEPTIKTLYHAWVQAEMGSESAGFYEFVSKVTGSTVTRENALQVPHADRQHVCNLIGLKKDVYPYTPALDEEEQAKEMEHFVELDKIGEEVAARRAADKAQPWPATTLDSKQVVNAQAAKAS